MCKKRKHNEVEKETEDANKVVLLDGLCIKSNGNKIRRTNHDVPLTKEKQLMLEQEKVERFKHFASISTVVS